MPTVTESQFLFSYLKFWSNFFIFPFEVNLIYNLSPLKATIWKLLYYLSVIYSIYNSTRTLALYIFYPERVILYHIPIVLLGAIAPPFFHLFCKPAYVNNHQTVRSVFNELMDNEETQPRKRKWKELTMTEFLGIYGMDVIFLYGYIGYLAIICVESNMSHLIINMFLFKQLRSNVLFVVFAYICEAYFSAMCFINGGFFMSLNFLVVSKVEAEMINIRANLRRCWRNMGRVRNLVCKLRQNQLYVQLFNIFNASFLQLSKTVMITTSIIGGYIGLRYQSQALVVIFCIYCHLACIVIYCFTFSRGYSVVVRQQNAKRACLAASKRIRERDARHEVLAAFRSVKCVGLEVGQFHEMERNSPIIFIDYVERQVIGLLLAF